jgi:CubicO group peptidase (beta-lactamase class C family)
MKIFKRIILGLAVLLAILIFVVLSNTYLRRYVVLNSPDVYDYKHLPFRVIKYDREDVVTFDKQSDFDVNNMLPLNFNGRKINNLDKFLSDNFTTAFIILKNDVLLYERYFNGHVRSTGCKSYSVSKNFISALIGIAIDEGLIKSVDEPVVNYVPELKDKRLNTLTIRHCLSATTGLKFHKGGAWPWQDDVRVYYSGDLRKLLSNIKFGEEPGTVYNTEEYSSCLLALVLERATHTKVSNYLSEKIWKPLGMEFDALWTLDREAEGLEVANSGLTARPIDFVKFGRLYLNKGNWNDKQIVPQKWIEESTVPDPNSISYWRDGYYNSMWWGTIKKDAYEYSANGHFSQRIYIAPEKNLVIVRFGTDTGGIDWSNFISTLIEKI